MHDLDSDLRSFQDCLWLQNFAGGGLNAVDHDITSDESPSASGGDTGKPGMQRPNNGIVILIGHGLGGLLAQAISSLILELSSEALHGHHLGLKKKDWRLILLGSPHLSGQGNILDDTNQISSIVSHYGGKIWNVYHTRGFWQGLQQHLLCLINDDWAEQSLNAPAEAHGRVRVASFREGVQDEAKVDIITRSE